LDKCCTAQHFSKSTIQTPRLYTGALAALNCHRGFAMPVKLKLRTNAPKLRDTEISDAAIKLFDKMRRLKCVCPSLADGDCFGCKRFRELDGELAVELRLKPWQFPACEDPTSSYAEDAEPCPEAQARWRALAQASAAARKAAQNGRPAD
jgi:hypothetical protein